MFEFVMLFECCITTNPCHILKEHTLLNNNSGTLGGKKSAQTHIHQATYTPKSPSLYLIIPPRQTSDHLLASLCDLENKLADTH